MIVIIDYGVGNLGSIKNMLKKIGVHSRISSNMSDIKAADKLILSGVGSFDCGMQNLHKHQLVEVLNDKVVDNKTPILGICLGMQLFTKYSEEGVAPGLGWFDAEVVGYKFDKGSSVLKVPHVGWNSVEPRTNSLLFSEMHDESRFYFVHSYYVKCNHSQDVLATTKYGYEFTSVIEKGHIVGVQFHPEKSHKFGMQMFKNFVTYY